MIKNFFNVSEFFQHPVSSIWYPVSNIRNQFFFIDHPSLSLPRQVLYGQLLLNSPRTGR